MVLVGATMLALLTSQLPDLSPRCGPLRAELLCEGAQGASAELTVIDGGDAGMLLRVERVLFGSPDVGVQAGTVMPLDQTVFHNLQAPTTPGTRIFAVQELNSPIGAFNFRVALPIQSDGSMIDPRDQSCDDAPQIQAEALAQLIGTGSADDCATALKNMDENFAKEECEGRRGIRNAGFCLSNGARNPDTQPSFCGCEEAVIAPFSAVAALYALRFIGRRRRASAGR